MISWLRSRNFALYLLIAFLAIAVEWSLVVAEKPNVVHEYITGVILVLIAISIIVSLIRRISIQIKRRAADRPFRHFGQRYVCRTDIRQTQLHSILRSNLLRYGWKFPKSSRRETVILEKGQVGVWGSIIFHFGLITIITGLIIGAALSYRGTFAITEGDTFSTAGTEPKLEERGWFTLDPTGEPLDVILEEFDPDYPSGNTTTMVSRVLAGKSGRHISGTIRTGFGLKMDDVTIHQVDWGYSPGLRLSDLNGDLLAAGFIRLGYRREAGGRNHTDSIKLDDNRTLELRFHPDYNAGLDGYRRGDVRRLKNPVLEVSLIRDEITELATVVPLGRGTMINGYQIAFPELRHWVQMEIVHDPGMVFLWIGSVLAIIGLAVRFAFIRRVLAVEVKITSDGTEIIISGWAEKYPQSFQDNLSVISTYIGQSLANGCMPAMPVKSPDSLEKSVYAAY